MKIIHTSDWHLGRTIYGKKRYEEMEAFLDWLSDEIDSSGADALLIAGDVFDNQAPSNRAQELYYKFLCRMSNSSCRHVVIIAGNHDCPAFLDAPRELLEVLDVHVIAAKHDNPEDEVLLFKNSEGEPELIVCAVPFLRDRDIRSAQPGESIEDKERKLLWGISSHYFSVSSAAVSIASKLSHSVPVIGMGHLFTAGGAVEMGDGVRDLYAGTLAHVDLDIFPECFDYVALGHLHAPQYADEKGRICYSGSPLPMSFAEASTSKSICIVDFTEKTPSVCFKKIPLFQELACIQGDWNQISSELSHLVTENSKAWVEVIYDGKELISDLRERIEMITAQSQIEVLRINNDRIANEVLSRSYEGETLDELTPEEVFLRCLNKHEIEESQRPVLMQTYKEALLSVYEEERPS